MRVVFMGSASLSCASLRSLVSSGADEVLAAVTQPPRPKGRRLKVSCCELGKLAAELGIPVLGLTDINAPDSVELLRELKPDVMVVVAYGQILRKEVLGIAPSGCVNVHASLLPKYRGAAPIQWAIARGEQVTGVSTMFMNEKMDDGDVIQQREVAIGEDDSAGQLHDRLALSGAELLMETLDLFRGGDVLRSPQNRAEATFAPRLRKADGKIDWSSSAQEIYNRFRGFDPWPGSFCLIPCPPPSSDGEESGANGSGVSMRLGVLRCRPKPGAGRPGEILECGDDGPLVAAGDGAVRLIEVKPEGRRAMSGAACLCGRRLSIGAVLE